MGISRDSRKKRRLTGGRMPIHQKKRKFEIGRQASNTKLGDSKIVTVRGRGGNIKQRALRLNEGNFSWVSEKVAKKCKIVNVIYNSTNNEIVRTNTIVKGNIVVIDPTPFKYYWKIHYENDLVGHLPEMTAEVKAKFDEKRSKNAAAHPHGEQLEKNNLFFNAMRKGRLYAKITSRPGQSGRADGYVLEGKELDFYSKKLEKKKK